MKFQLKLKLNSRVMSDGKESDSSAGGRPGVTHLCQAINAVGPTNLKSQA